MIKISAVSYTNTIPFLFGLEKIRLKYDLEIALDYPAIVADKLIKGTAQIGLVPVAVIPELKDAQIISDYCIGADGRVHSVLLLSNKPIHEIKRIYLDYQSKTSVNLCRILCAEHWKITPEFIPATPGYLNHLLAFDAAVIIGDRAMDAVSQFPYHYDLAEEWKKHTNLPFVFACWVNVDPTLDRNFLNAFNEALAYGVANREEAIVRAPQAINKDKLIDYVNNYISYKLDEAKKTALETFLKRLSKMNQINM